MTTSKATRATQARGFLERLNKGPLTLGQLLAALRKTDQLSLAQFAARLGISRQHLHQIERGRKHVSPARAVNFARALRHSPLLFVKLALQDQLKGTGLRARVELKAAS